MLYISDEPFYQQEPIRRQMVALCSMIHEVDPADPDLLQHLAPRAGLGRVARHLGHRPVRRCAPETMARIRAGARRSGSPPTVRCASTRPTAPSSGCCPTTAFRYGAEAYEFWGIAWLTHDPYRFGWHAYIDQTDQPGQSYWIRYPNGDGFLLYPGKPIGHAGPVSSIRLEQAREGVEDYEYLYLLRSLAARAKTANRDTSRALRSPRRGQKARADSQCRRPPLDQDFARAREPVPRTPGRWQRRSRSSPDS